MSNYKNAYIRNQKLNFIIPIIVILFLGAIYIVSERSGVGFVGYILIGIATLTIVYWIKIIKNMTKNKEELIITEADTKNWVYDLITDNNEKIFVAEIPGPENKITVRLIKSILYVKSTNNFYKEVKIEGAEYMQIYDFKYKNGVLTLKIKKL